MSGETEEKTIRVPHRIEPVRLDKYLASQENLDLSRSHLQSIISDGLVKVDGKIMGKKHKLKGGELIELTIPPPSEIDLSPEDIPLEIVFEDEHLAVINKPAGLVVHPAPGNLKHTLVNALVYHFGQVSQDKNDIRPGIVHRLDKDTSGVLIVAKNDSIARRLREMMADRKITKIYNAIICGHMPEESGVIELPIGRSLKDRKKMTVTNIASREAVTHYQVSERFRHNDLVEVKIETGRTHQIRVHFAHLNRPVLGDPDYGGRQKWLKGIDPSARKAGKEILELIDRQALHARRLIFIHPITGNELSIEGDLPKDFNGVLRYLQEKYR